MTRKLISGVSMFCRRSGCTDIQSSSPTSRSGKPLRRRSSKLPWSTTSTSWFSVHVIDITTRAASPSVEDATGQEGTAVLLVSIESFFRNTCIPLHHPGQLPLRGLGITSPIWLSMAQAWTRFTCRMQFGSVLQFTPLAAQARQNPLNCHRFAIILPTNTPSLLHNFVQDGTWSHAFNKGWNPAPLLMW